MSDWRVKFDGSCSKCGTLLAAATPAVWDRATRKMSCIECPPVEPPSPPPIDPGDPGASARRKYERLLAKRESANKSRWGERFGGLVTRYGAVPQSTAAWGIGARGEELLAAALAGVPDLVVLHDRRVAGTKGNIDHIVVAPAGVFVVDAKHYDGQIDIRDRGGFFRVDLRLTVNRRDQSKLARAMSWQVEAVTKALAEAAIDPLPPITPVLCFVGGYWPLLSRPKEFEGVRLETERSIAKLLTSTALIDREMGDRLARIVAAALPPMRTRGGG